ncbi:MAG: hypothetical protein QXE07_03190 [Thermoplasmata archaeon]
MNRFVLLIFYFFSIHYVSQGDSTKFNSLNIKIDISMNSVGNRTLTYFLTKYKSNYRIYYISFGPQYNFIKTKKNRTIIKGGYFDLGKEAFRVLPSRDIFGNLNLDERFHLNFYFLRTGLNYSVIFKKNLGLGGEIFFKYIFLEKSPTSSPEFYYRFVHNHVFPQYGLISYVTNENIKYLDLTTSLFMVYQKKRNIFLFKINFPHFIEGEWFSWGLTYIHSIFYGRKNKK